MKRLVVLFALAACGDDPITGCITRGPGACGPLDSGNDVVTEDCFNPLTQQGCFAGEKCTWIVDSTVPHYVGHVDCAPDGTKSVGDTCMFGAAGATGYDDCRKGGVCSAFEHPGTQGVCEQICDIQGGNPKCDSTHACVAYRLLFSTGATSPPGAGICDVSCDPLADNDFDGSGSALSRTGSSCGSATVGCYGIPSQGTPPATAFTCREDLHYTTALRHRSECTVTTGCADASADGSIYVNSCNQGYEPLIRESTSVSTAVCVALCAPLDCYAGNCGSNDVNRRGAFPHRCMPPDAVGNFGSDEECEYLWTLELDGGGTYLPSAYGNTVGFCADHAAYGLPSCADLPLHGSGSALGADDLGCVSTTTAGLSFTSKRPALPRTLYHRVMR